MIRNGRRALVLPISPHDEHDYDGVNEQILLDIPFGGAMRKVLVHPDRNGYIYVIDRQTGQVLSADPFAPINSPGRGPQDRQAYCQSG